MKRIKWQFLKECQLIVRQEIFSLQVAQEDELKQLALASNLNFNRLK
jgi:hypothetical protein